MASFTKSYLTSEQLEQLEMSKIAASSSPSIPLDVQLQQPLVRPPRHIPAELRAPPFVPAPDIAQATEAEHPFNRPNKGIEDDPFRVQSTGLDPTASSAEQEVQQQEVKRARPSQIGRMLFPPSSNVDASSQGSPRTKRHSYSGQTAPPFTLNPLSASTSSLPAPSSRIPIPAQKAVSPVGPLSQLSTSLARASSSSSSSRATESTAVPTSIETSLLALPLAKELEALKQRNRDLVGESETNRLELSRATDRIRHLELNLSTVESSRGIDAEGWEAEASRLTLEVSVLQRDRVRLEQVESNLREAEKSLEMEQAKKRRQKEMMNKLRCELINRRWKEKYEIELLEKEERNWEIKLVESEFDAAVLRGELGCERAEREELETIVATQKKRISTLSASRQLLLDSFNTSEATIASLRSSLSRVQKDFGERDAEIKRYKEQVGGLKQELEEARTKDSQAEGKLREKNRTLKDEVKDLKTQLESSQKALEAADQSTNLATSSLESTRETLATVQARYDALILASTTTGSIPHSSSTVKARAPAAVVTEKKRPPPARVESDSEEAEIVEPLSPPVSKRKAPTKLVKEKVAAPRKKRKEIERDAEGEEDEEETAGGGENDEEEEDLVPTSSIFVKKQPKATIKRAEPVEKKKKKLKQSIEEPPSDVVVDQEEEEDKDEEAEDDDDQTPRPTPVSPRPAPPVAAAKKRKAEVLADKSTNSKKKSKDSGEGTGQGKGRGGGSSTTATKVKKGGKETKQQNKKKLNLDLTDDETPPPPPAKEEPAKKKKRTLFGGPKKAFDWQTEIENADVNGFIPSNLSPIKTDKTGTKKGGNLGIGAMKKSIF